TERTTAIFAVVRLGLGKEQPFLKRSSAQVVKPVRSGSIAQVAISYHLYRAPFSTIAIELLYQLLSGRGQGGMRLGDCCLPALKPFFAALLRHSFLQAAAVPEPISGTTGHGGDFFANV